MGREKFNGERPLRLPPPPEAVRELLEFNDGDRPCEGTEADTGEYGPETPLLEDSFRGSWEKVDPALELV